MGYEKKRSLGIVLDEKVYQDLKVRAHDEWRPMSQQIRMAISAGLEKTDLGRISDEVRELRQAQAQMLALLKKLHPDLQS